MATIDQLANSSNGHNLTLIMSDVTDIASSVGESCNAIEVSRFKRRIRVSGLGQSLKLQYGCSLTVVQT